jgi:preprotein translocase subunit SecE
MSRALRRHPAGSSKGARQGSTRPAVPGRGVKRRPQQQAPESRGIRGLLQPRWATDIINELRKVTWPSMEDTRYLTFVVLVVSVAFGVFLGGVDMFFNWFIDRTLF